MKILKIKSLLTMLVCFISINLRGQALAEQDYSEMARIFAEDVQLLGDSRDDYHYYQATHPWEPFSHSRVFALNKSQNTNRGINKVLIIVTSSMYNQLAVKINRYASDIHDVYGCEVIMETVSGGNHVSIKNLILSHQTNLSGAVFIGEIAPAWFEIDNAYHNGYAVWPCDLYYMDLNGTWLDTDGNGIFDTHTGDVQPEIFVGRVSAKNMGTLISEKDGLERYLDKNHNFWNGNIIVNKKFGLSYADPIGNGSGVGDIIYLYGISNADIIISGQPGYGKIDYMNRLNNPRYEFIHILCHATPTTLAMPGGSIYSNEIYYNESVAFGYFLSACSACNWTAANSNGFLGGTHVYNAGISSLVAVGYTKICSALGLNIFFSLLGLGKTMGETVKQWGINISPGTISDYYGITIVGDPLINFYYTTTTSQPMTWEIGSPIPSNVVATFENETLTITGTGATQDYQLFQDQPWASVRNNIKNLIINSGVTTIGNNAFRGCGVLLVNIPKGITKIGDYAFSDCSSLSSVTIPNTITDFGIRALQNCSNLTDVFVQWSFPYFVSESVFYGVTTANVNLYVPCGKGSLYANASVWQNFNIIDTNIQTITFEPLPPKTYGDGAITLNATSNSSLPIVFQSSNTNVATVSGNTLTILNAGTTTITATQNGDNCYNSAEPVSHILTVNKTNLLVTAEDKSRIYGEENPLFTLTYLGWVNGDDVNSLTTQPETTCDASPTSDVGDYTIFVSGGVSSNYYIIYQFGTLTITKAPQDTPEAPTLESKTTTSITLNIVSGCEYNINGGTWQSSPTFAGLTPNTSYTFTQRKAETMNHFASEASAPAIFSTDETTVPIYTIISSVNNITWGTIAPYGVKFVEEGSSIEFTISSNTGYIIDSVFVNGMDKGAINTYTFENVQENGTIAVVFKNDVGINDKELYEITIYPNPTTGELKIENGELKIQSIEIFDIYGRNVEAKFPSFIPNAVGNPEHYGQQADGVVMDVSHLPSGVYFVKITTETGEIKKKVLKM